MVLKYWDTCQSSRHLVLYLFSIHFLSSLQDHQLYFHLNLAFFIWNDQLQLAVACIWALCPGLVWAFPSFSSIVLVGTKSYSDDL